MSQKDGKIIFHICGSRSQQEHLAKHTHTQNPQSIHEWVLWHHLVIFTSMPDLIISSFCILIFFPHSKRTEKKNWNAMFGDTAKSPIYQNTAFKLNSKSWSIWGSHWFLLFYVQWWYENEIHHHKLAHLSGVWARHSVGIKAKGHSMSHSNLWHSAYGCLWEGILFPWRFLLKLDP